MYFKHYWEGALKRFLIRTPLRSVMDWVVRNWLDYNPITHKGPATEPAADPGVRPPRAVRRSPRS